MTLRCESDDGRFWCKRFRCWFCGNVLCFRGADCSRCTAHQGGQADIDFGCAKHGARA